MKEKVRRKYDKEFKMMVVNLCLSGRIAREIAEEMDLDRSMVQRWVREYHTYKDNSFQGNGNPVLSSEQEEISRLKADLRHTQIERDILKKGCEHILQERQQKLQFIDSFRKEFTVEDMCRVLSVSKSGYYEWLSRKESPRAIALKKDTEEVLAIYYSSKKRYGSPKIHAELGVRGIHTSRNRVARIMKQASIRSIVNKKYKIQTTDSNHSNKISPNHLNRNFYPKYPSETWVSDITYVHTEQGWLYLTTIMDLYDRKIIGWSLSNNMTTNDTVLKAWRMATTNRKINPNMIFHSDRGVQYTAEAFRSELKEKCIIQSMSRKGNCWDNAVAECFFKIIKSELIDHKYYYSHLQAKIDIVEFIEIWYNRKRIHSVLGYLSPEEYGKINYLIAA